MGSKLILLGYGLTKRGSADSVATKSAVSNLSPSCQKTVLQYTSAQNNLALAKQHQGDVKVTLEEAKTNPAAAAGSDQLKTSVQSDQTQIDSYTKQLADLKKDYDVCIK